MKLMNLILLGLLLFALVACDEKATLKIEQGGSSSGGSTPQNSDKLWESVCYETGDGNYYRNYIQITKFNHSIVTGKFYSQGDCLDSDNGRYEHRDLLPLEDKYTFGEWTGLTYRYESGNVFIYKIEGAKLIQIYENLGSYWDFANNQLLGGTVDENDLLEHQSIEKMPDIVMEAN